MTTKTQETLIDLERSIASLAELESESLAEGDDSLAEVWRARRLRAEYKRDKLKRGAA